MGCLKGSNGIDICDAELCCIQFGNDCIDDAGACAKLTDGRSIVFVDAAGDLRICSNIGGICSCEYVGENIVIPDPFVLPTVSVIGISSSPQVTYNDPGCGGDGCIPGVTTAGLSPVSLVVSNPSLTRNMTVSIQISNYDADFSFDVGPGDLSASYAIQPVVLIDGIPYNNPFGTDDLLNLQAIDTDIWETDNSNVPIYAARLLPPGGSVTISCTATLLVQTPHSAANGARIGIGNCFILGHGVLE